MPIRTDIPDLHHWRVITDAEIERIHDAALQILNNSGFRIHCRPILEKLDKLGFKVDYTSGAVRPTPHQMALVAKTARAHAGQLTDLPLLRRSLPATINVGHNYTCYYDWTEGVRRPATVQDIRNVVKAWHMIPEITGTGPCMTAQDAPAAIEPILTTVETMKLTNKISGCPEMMLASQLQYFEELETIMAGRQVRYHVNGCSVNHFTLDERAAGCLMAVAKNGLEHWWVNSCPVAGANAPITLAGAVTASVAEIMGAWLAGWALNQDVGLSAIPLGGILDMRTTRVMFSTPESVLIDCAIYQFFYRMFGLETTLCTGYTDAKTPGMQAFNDKMLKSLAYGLFTKHIGGQTGTLEAGNTYSPTQQVIDLEINRQTMQLVRGMEVNDDTMAVAEIEQFVPDDSQSFLMMDHTLKHWKESIWMPSLMDRSSFESPEAERKKELQVVERAEARWRDALAAYTPPRLDEDNIKAAEKVLEQARKKLC
jgi:trimethylamine--corrinoid protein Co-methyltransferase